uniref:Uncharacterized protein n=1 Tax=Arundo donax TaxID=35708 RepID=A0A0A9BFW8_ARUDO
MISSLTVNQTSFVRMVKTSKFSCICVDCSILSFSLVVGLSITT